MMILQTLTKYYEYLASRGEIEIPGWSSVKINYALCLDTDGHFQQIVSLCHEELVGKKTVLRPRIMQLPAAVKRSSAVSPNFLWDNAGYVLGFDIKNSPARTKECFESFRALHHLLLDTVESPVARAILSFLDSPDITNIVTDPCITAISEDLKKGVNLLFRVSGQFAEEDPAIRKAWQVHYSQGIEKPSQCLVTGTYDSIEPVHPSIMGVQGAQSSGAALVSFNAPAFCSYGKEQNFNAPIGKYATFAYTTALNHLLSDRDNVQHIGDTTVVCWAEGADQVYQVFAMDALFGDLNSNDLRNALKRLAHGLPCDELGLDPQRPFYVLGLAPNAARLSVRFFIRDSFGSFMRNVNTHHERLEIEKPSFDPHETLSLYMLLQETVNQNVTVKAPSSVMSGAVTRAIFSDSLYPASLIENTMLRIRSEKKVNRCKAAIIKAYYLKNIHPDCPKEVLTVGLNETSVNIPYTLGRLFSVYESIQESATPGINTTIKDKYFNSAASTPGTVFPLLDGLCQKHLRKLDTGKRIYFEKQIIELKGILGEENPLRLSLPAQGSFYLGYYHQTQKRYKRTGDQ